MELYSADGASHSPSPQQLLQLRQLVRGYQASQAIHVISRLGIADLLASSPKTCDELAESTGTHAPSLYRLMRFLAAAALFAEVKPRCFALTPLGAGMRTDVKRSEGASARMLMEEANWQAWGHLMHTVQTGETAFDYVHGMGRFEYLRRHPESAVAFQNAMTAGVEAGVTALINAYDFCAFERVIDVAGGHGAVLAAVLRACPNTRGVLFDSPEVVVGAAGVLEQACVADRCEVVGGDLFTALPPGGDAYILRQIVHDWDDAQTVHILRNCRAAMNASSRLLVIERAIAADPQEALPVLGLDMEMMVTVGGMERTENEYEALFAEAGLRLNRVVPLGDQAHFAVFEGLPT